jgi:hypothetical protein
MGKKVSDVKPVPEFQRSSSTFGTFGTFEILGT